MLISLDGTGQAGHTIAASRKHRAGPRPAGRGIF